MKVMESKKEADMVQEETKEIRQSARVEEQEAKHKQKVDKSILQESAVEAADKIVAKVCMCVCVRVRMRERVFVCV